MSDATKAFVEAFENVFEGGTATEEPVEAPVEPSEDDWDDSDDEVPEEPVEAAEELVEPSTDEEPAVTEKRLWAGKYETPEDMEAGLRELQALKDRQIAEIQAKVEAFEAILAGNGPEPEPAPVEVTEEQLVNAVEQAPIDTFQWTIQNRPDLVPSVIGLVRDRHGNVTADQMQAAFNNAVMMAQQQAMMEQFENTLQATLGPQQTQQNFIQAVDAVAEKYGEDFEDLREDTAEVLSEIGELESYDPSTVALAVEYAFLQAYRNRALAAPEVSPTPSPQEFVERGSPGKASEVPTGDDAVRAEIEKAFGEMWK